MTFEKIYETVKKSLAKAKADVVNGDVAFECVIVGEGEGKFYIQVKDGSVNVEPYDYWDNDARLIADAETFTQIAGGKLSPVAAYTNGQLHIQGDVGRALELKALIESVPAPKKKRTKEEIEAEKAAKEAAKAQKEAEKAAKAAEKEAAKKAAAEKKAAAKKEAPKKAPVKKAAPKKAEK